MDLTDFLRRYAVFRNDRLAKEDPLLSQRRTLLALLRKARRTQFGRDYNFSSLKSIAAYQEATPLRRYDDFWNDYWSAAYPVLDNVTWPGLIPFFAKSSGTSSGVTKHIPVSAEMVHSNRRAAIDVMVHHLAAMPQSRLLGGKSFLLGGSPALATVAPDVREGDLSGIAAAQLPFWAKGFYFPSGKDAAITDWEEKTSRLAKRAAKLDIRSLSGTPSWVLLFLETMFREMPKGKTLADYWPKLELIVHGGVSFTPYRQRFAALLEGSHAETREVYPASEGFIALQDKSPEEGLRLLTDNGLFFEFVPVEELDSPNPRRHWLGNAEIGVNYALVLTTNAGLWSYVIGDMVRLVSLAPPRLLVTGRLSYGLSAFGEHLIGAEIDSAVAEAAAKLGLTINDYMAGPVFPAQGLGHHLYLIEAECLPGEDKRAAFAGAIDADLIARNADYAEHRAGNFGMGGPEVVFLGPGSFAAWMKARGKLGGQNKVPRVMADAAAFAAARAALIS